MEAIGYETIFNNVDLASDFTAWENSNAKFEEKFEWVVKALRSDDIPESRHLNRSDNMSKGAYLLGRS